MSRLAIFAALPIAGAIGLAGCAAEEPSCVARFAELTRRIRPVPDASSRVEATYTFDVTRLPRPAFERLIRHGVGEGAPVIVASPGMRAADLLSRDRKPADGRGRVLVADRSFYRVRLSGLAPARRTAERGCRLLPPEARLVGIDVRVVPRDAGAS